MQATVIDTPLEPPRRASVVVVDDDLAVCRSLKFALELEGFSVRTFGGGADLLAAGGIDTCDCFVIDQKMPEMTGMELIAQLRHRTIRSPIILLVSHPTSAVSAAAARAGVPVVEKPLLGDTLVDEIREACARR